MTDVDPDDERLRSAFEHFRADAMDAVTPAGATAVRATARHRQRARVALTGSAAGLVLIAAVGTGLLITQGAPDNPPDTTAAASRSAERQARGSAPASTPDLSPTGTNGRTASPQGSAGAWGVSVALDTGAVPMTAADNGYAGTVSFTVHNEGSQPIPHTAVRVTVPSAVSFDGTDGTADCRPGRTCVVDSVDNLAPGETNTVHGTLRYRQQPDGSQHQDTPPPSGSVSVLATDTHGDRLADTEQDFTLALRTGTPTTTPSQPPPTGTASPTPTGSDPDHQGSGGQPPTG